MGYSIKEKFVTKLQKIPFSIPFLITVICIYGFVILYSAAGGQIEPWAYRQIIIFSIFMPLAFIISMVDTRFIYKFSYFLYFFVLLLLIAVAIIGKTVMGATRWIDLGVFYIQPSEPTKIAIVLMLARYFHSSKEQNISSIYNLILPIIGVLIPAFLIIKQPDLGTGIITIIVATIIFFAAGVKKLYFVIVGIGSLILLPIVWTLLHNYQKNRVLIFLNPDREPLGAGYNIIQSKIAIGSGGFWGKGLLNGTQSHLSFLPEYTTDFIFSFLTEESIFTKLMVIGLTSIFFSHVFINIGMVMGMMPVVGVPLPFISYGGTMMVSMLISFGLIMNASLHQHSNLHTN
jgi:rod shape determining protein RodA